MCRRQEWKGFSLLLQQQHFQKECSVIVFLRRNPPPPPSSPFSPPPPPPPHTHLIFSFLLFFLSLLVWHCEYESDFHVFVEQRGAGETNPFESSVCLSAEVIVPEVVIYKHLWWVHGASRKNNKKQTKT